MDGQVGATSIGQCDSFICEHKLKFRFVSAFIIGDEGNLSVVCPFTRRRSHVVHAISSSGTEIASHEIAHGSDDDALLIAKIDEIATVEQFEASFDGLGCSLTLQTLGTVGNRRLRNEAVDMQNRLARDGSRRRAHRAAAALGAGVIALG
jgi:hypothetical protein